MAKSSAQAAADSTGAIGGQIPGHRQDSARSDGQLARVEDRGKDQFFLDPGL